MRNKHEEDIIIMLHESPKRFNELREATKPPLSPEGLTKVLKRLSTASKIEKIIYKGNKAYVLSEKGNEVYKNIWYIQHLIEDLKEKKARYIHSSIYEGIEANLIQENDPGDSYSLLPDVSEFLNFILKSTFTKLLEGDKFNVQGQYFISFAFDMSRFIKKLQTIKLFVENLKNNIDIFEFKDKERRFNWNRTVIMANGEGLTEMNYNNTTFDWNIEISSSLSALIEAENFYDEGTLTTIKENMLKMFKKHEGEIFTQLKKPLYEAIKEDINCNKNPLKDKKIEDQLVVVENGRKMLTTTIFDYLNGIRALNLDNNELVGRITNLREQVNEIIKVGGIK